MYFCLNREELKILIDSTLDSIQVNEKYLKKIIEDSSSWLCTLGVVNYSFALFLEQKKKLYLDRIEFVQHLYSIDQYMDFQIHEIEKPLVDFMMSDIPDRQLTLEENLIDLQKRFYNHDYSKSIRY